MTQWSVLIETFVLKERYGETHIAILSLLTNLIEVCKVSPNGLAIPSSESCVLRHGGLASVGEGVRHWEEALPLNLVSHSIVQLEARHNRRGTQLILWLFS